MKSQGKLSILIVFSKFSYLELINMDGFSFRLFACGASSDSNSYDMFNYCLNLGLNGNGFN